MEQPGEACLLVNSTCLLSLFVSFFFIRALALVPPSHAQDGPKDVLVAPADANDAGRSRSKALQFRNKRLAAEKQARDGVQSAGKPRSASSSAPNGATGGSRRGADGKRLRRDDLAPLSSGQSVGGFEFVLKADLTWTSTAGFGPGNYIQGRWNVFEDSVDLHSGIKGAGQRFWLQYRPFGILGGAKAKGVPGLEEFVYLGKVRDV